MSGKQLANESDANKEVATIREATDRISLDKNQKKLSLLPPSSREEREYRAGDDWRRLAEAINKSTSLKSLSLVKFPLSPTTGNAFIQVALRNNSSLHRLNLSSNNLSGSGTDSLVQYLRSSNCSLVYLVLNYCRLHGNDQVKVYEAAAHAKSLRGLSLRGCQPRKNGARALYAFLKQNRTLTQLNIIGAKLQESQVVELAEVLEGYTTLKQLQIRGNRVKEQGALALADWLKTNTTLEELNVIQTQLTRAGAQALCDMLKVNSTLKTLRTRGNRLNGNKVADFDYLSYAAENDALRDCARFQTAASVGKAPWKRSRLMVVGEGNVGKTATVRSLLFKEFDPEWKSTIGVSTIETKLTEKYAWKESERQHFLSSLVQNILATPNEKKKKKEQPKAKSTKAKKGQAQPKTTIPVQSSTSPTLVQSDPKESSSTSWKKPVTTIQTTTTGRSEAKRGPRKVYAKPKEHIFQFDKELFTNDDGGTGVHVSVWDYGGQAVFHTLHHLLLSKYGVYMLVFNLPALVRDESEAYEYIDFWLHSVALHAEDAPIVIVGTFADGIKAKSDLEKVEKVVQSLADNTTNIARAEKLSFFPIDNRSQQGINTLRSKIETVCKTQEHVNFEVASKWLTCLDTLVQTGRPWLGLPEVKEVCRESGITSADEVETMLKVFHEFGVVLYFTSTENLREIVTLNPQWLIDQISKVIRDDGVHAEKYPMEELKQAGLFEDLSSMFKTALASRDILEFFWNHTQRNFLVDLMRKLLLLSRWQFDSSEEIYLVPSLLKPSTSKVSVSGITCELRFTFLPNGVFERLMCLAVDYSSQFGGNGTAQPLLHYDVCTVTLGTDNMVSFKREKKEIFIVIQKEEFAARTLQVVLAMMKKLKQDIMGKRFMWQVFLQPQSQSQQRMSLQEVKKNSSPPWFAQTQESQGGTTEGHIAQFFNSF